MQSQLLIAKREDDADLQRLKWAMTQLGLKPGTLGRKCGVSPRRITDLLCGKDRCWPIRAAINKTLRIRLFTKAGSTPPPSIDTLIARRGFTIEHGQPVDIIACKIAMLQRGLSTHALAKRAKLPSAIVSNVLAHNDKSWPPRAKINAALGLNIFQQPIRKKVSKPATTP